MITSTNSGEEIPEHESYIAGICRCVVIYLDSVTTNMALYNSFVISKLDKLSSFLIATSQRNVATSLTITAQENAELLFPTDVCENVHSKEKKNRKHDSACSDQCKFK